MDIGILCRNFPTREYLVEVIHHQELEALGAAAKEPKAKHPSNVDLDERVYHFVGYIAAKRGGEAEGFEALERLAVCSRQRGLTSAADGAKSSSSRPGYDPDRS